MSRAAVASELSWTSHVAKRVPLSLKKVVAISQRRKVRRRSEWRIEVFRNQSDCEREILKSPLYCSLYLLSITQWLVRDSCDLSMIRLSLVFQDNFCSGCGNVNTLSWRVRQKSDCQDAIASWQSVTGYLQTCHLTEVRAWSCILFKLINPHSIIYVSLNIS